MLRLWWHVTDVPEKAAGPAMAARLRGTAFQMAMRLTTQRISLDAATGAVTSTPLTGAEALACQSMPEFTHPHTGEVVAAQRAGATLLMHALQAEFLPHNQNLVIAALDQWDTLMIPHCMSRADFLLLFRMSFEEAEEHGGLQINNIGRSYYLLKKCSCSRDERRDYLLQVSGDLNRYEDIYNIVKRFAREDSDVTSN